MVFFRSDLHKNPIYLFTNPDVLSQGKKRIETKGLVTSSCLGWHVCCSAMGQRRGPHCNLMMTPDQTTLGTSSHVRLLVWQVLGASRVPSRGRPGETPASRQKGAPSREMHSPVRAGEANGRSEHTVTSTMSGECRGHLGRTPDRGADKSNVD